MHPFPHHYRAHASGGSDGPVAVSGQGLPPIETDAPPEFGGAGGHWSPETLLIAAVADCYILSFRAVARASRLEWLSLAVDVEGVLEKVDGVTRFTRLKVSPLLSVAPGTSETLAHSVLHKAEKVCLVTNSLSAESELHPTLQSVATEEVAPGT